MKKMFLILFITGIFFCSCASTTYSAIPVPFENRIIEKNISIEYYNIAKAYQDVKNYDKAITYYKKSLSNRELRDSIIYEMGFCYVYQGKWEEAYWIFRRLLKNDKDNLNLKLSLAYIQAMRGNYSIAEKMYLELFKDNDYDVSILKNLISVYIQKEQYDKAQEYIHIMEEKFPDDENLDKIKKALQDKMDSENDDNETDKKSSEGKNKEGTDKDKEKDIFNTDDVKDEDNPLLKDNEKDKENEKKEQS